MGKYPGSVGSGLAKLPYHPSPPSTCSRLTPTAGDGMGAGAGVGAGAGASSTTILLVFDDIWRFRFLTVSRK
jgi:hypothetical protein